MKVTELATDERRGLSPLKAKVLQFLEAHTDEVFSYRDEGLARALGTKLSALSFTLWGLHRDGRIDKEEVDRKVYFGSHRAIADLRRRLGLTSRDPFEEARSIRDRAWARTGDIDVVALLDEVRGSWE